MVKKFYPMKKDVFHKIIWGKQGDGKDLLAVSWIKKEYEERQCKIFSVGELKGIPYTRVTCFDDVVNARGDPDNIGILYWHDMDLEFDSRSSMKNTEKQKKLLFLVNQLRKRSLALIGTIHRINSIDVKLRNIVKFWYIPVKYCVGDKGNMYDYLIHYKKFDEYGEPAGQGVLSGEDMVECCNCYNTFEEISSILD